ncbi:MAG: LysR family transcriptional regulator [Betaproteobacteria bacterium]|nr:LysR family transcriptional regulator [Betaproteobacteria bacterium]
MDRLHLINVFVAVVDANGFAGAARKLNVSPPAVTRAINELESHLGVRLLTRTTRAIRVTEAGARYAEDSRRILAEILEADESMGGMHGAPRGRLTLTAPVLFGARFVTPIVTEYLRRYPEVNASCWFMGRVVNMLDEGVDVAVRIGDPPGSSPQAVSVGHVRRVICAAPAYLAKRGIPLAIEDVQTHCVVAVNPTAQQPEWRLYEGGTERVVRLKPRMSTNGNESAIAAALNGFGITRVLSYQVAEYLRDGQLKIVLSEFEPAPLTVTVVHRDGRHAAPKARAFMDLAIERLRTNPALN